MDAQQDPIVAYYDALAPRYDADRFGNSYGRFIDRQEQRLLRSWLPKGGTILDLGCGTGRLSHLATHGCDASSASIAIARQKHPGNAFAVADLTRLPYPDTSFSALFCLHVGMHLDAGKLEAVFQEAVRVLQPGGIFVFDIASAMRRGMARRPATGWHGGTCLSGSELAAMGASAGLSLTGIHGIAMAPIHRLPEVLRPALLLLDNLLCGLVPGLASYLVARFRKEAAA